MRWNGIFKMSQNNEMEAHIENKGNALACGLVLLYIGCRSFYLLCTNGSMSISEVVILNIIVITKAINIWYLRRKLVGDDATDKWYAPVWWKLGIFLFLLFILLTDFIVWISIWLL